MGTRTTRDAVRNPKRMSATDLHTNAFAPKDNTTRTGIAAWPKLVKPAAWNTWTRLTWNARIGTQFAIRTVNHQRTGSAHVEKVKIVAQRSWLVQLRSQWSLDWLPVQHLRSWKCKASQGSGSKFQQPQREMLSFDFCQAEFVDHRKTIATDNVGTSRTVNQFLLAFRIQLAFSIRVYSVHLCTTHRIRVFCLEIAPSLVILSHLSGLVSWSCFVQQLSMYSTNLHFDLWLFNPMHKIYALIN